MSTTPDANPIALSQRLSRPVLPKRFYREATTTVVDGGHGLLLDGKQARTPGRSPLVAPTVALGEALADEWNAQGETINPATMPVTRILNAAIDGVSQSMDGVRAEVSRYAETDLVCYRADGPEALVARQERHSGPLIAWSREALGIRLVLAEGVMPVRQDAATLAAVADAVSRLGPAALAALHVATTIAGSVIVGLALASGRLTAEETWAAGNVDEDWETAQWGEDAEAAARRANRWRDFAAAALILRETR